MALPIFTTGDQTSYRRKLPDQRALWPVFSGLHTHYKAMSEKPELELKTWVLHLQNQKPRVLTIRSGLQTLITDHLTSDKNK